MGDARYPAPDRSTFVPNEFRDDKDLPEGDLGAREHEIADGRPARVEAWFSEGATYVTVFFSVLELEGATPDALLRLVLPALEREGVPEKHRRLGADGVHEIVDASGVHEIVDASGNRMYSLTFVVGEAD